MNVQFPKLTADQWLAEARRNWRMTNGELHLTYDIRIARTLAGFDIARPLPPLWNEFDTLSRVPMLVIRGANSDVLSAATVTAMRARRGKLESIEVADQGHVPLLEGDDHLLEVARFVDGCEVASRAAPAVGAAT
jgi:pimeloyl-ACP methyl ester carboxylesterase